MLHFLPDPEKPLWSESPEKLRPPPRGEVHVWRATIPPSPSAELQSNVSEAELRYAERMTAESARRQFIAAQAALRLVLARYLGHAAAELRFFRGEHGKPFLARDYDSDLQFNLSHSHDLAVVAVTDRNEIGIDVEKVRPRDAAPRLAARFFAERERDLFEASPADDRERVFFRLWTRKESHLKATGTGLSVNLKAIDTLAAAADWWYHEFAPHEEYVATVAGNGDRPVFSYYNLPSR